MTRTSKTTTFSGHKPTVVFFGNERLATGVTTDAPTLRALISNGYKVGAVVSHYSSGTSRYDRTLEIAEVAKKNNIPIFLPTKLSDIAEDLRSIHADIGVLVAYGAMVPQEIIDIFPNGIVNIHPSPLPLLRGSTPVERAILDGSKETAVSLMQIVKKMDAGPVFVQRKVPLVGHETKQQLSDLLLGIGSEMLIRSLPGIINGDITPTPQDDSRATFCKLINKNDGIVDLNKPADQLEREIRAYIGWPKSRASFGSINAVITEAHVVAGNDRPVGQIYILDEQPKAMAIQIGDGVLVIDKLVPEGKKEMPSQAFLAGYKDRVFMQPS